VAEVCEARGRPGRLKWPNDVLVDGRKVAGILVEGRPQEGWAVLGIGLNVAVRPQDLPPELRDRAGGLGLEPSEVEPVLAQLLEALSEWMPAPDDAVLAATRARDALLGRPVRWGGGSGIGAGLDEHGHLLVETETGRIALNAGEVHLGP
jgi:BirA family biotin operon repressor/biotin-[acetyl-CoA-carboxylase] ligase